MHRNVHCRSFDYAVREVPESKSTLTMPTTTCIAVQSEQCHLQSRAERFPLVSPDIDVPPPTNYFLMNQGGLRRLIVALHYFLSFSTGLLHENDGPEWRSYLKHD